MRGAFVFFALALLLLAGCAGKEPLPAEQEPANEQVVCEPPMILVPTGIACCEDLNGNGICDMVESAPVTRVVELEPNFFNSSITCKRSPLDGYVSCIITWLPNITYYNPSQKNMALSASFSGWDEDVIRIAQLVRRTSSITALDGQDAVGYTANVSAGASYPILLSVDVPKWNDSLESTAHHVSVRVCTHVDGSLNISCQNTTYSFGVGVQP